jgi:hypothetical protein
VQELIDLGAKAVVLSKGFWETPAGLSRNPEVLGKNGIKAEVL